MKIASYLFRFEVFYRLQAGYMKYGGNVNRNICDGNFHTKGREWDRAHRLIIKFYNTGAKLLDQVQSDLILQ